MKKVLLTLFAFALAITACEKDAYDNDAESINVIEASKEIGVDLSSINSASDYADFLTTIVESEGIQNELTAKDVKGNESTAKAGDFGSNYIQALFFDYTFIASFGERDYAYFRSDNYDLMCADAATMSNVTEISYTLAPHPTLTSFSNLITEAITGSETTSDTRLVNTAGWQDTFNADFNRVFPSNEERTSIIGGAAPPVARFDTACVEGVDLSSLYSITPAPQPLEGFLATIIDAAGVTTMGGSSLNYAASSEEAVRTAIENDIMDGN